jgi:hypothetical protein
MGIDMDTLAIIRLALSVIADRLLVIIAMILGFSLAIWIMWYPEWIRLGAMIVFVLFSYMLLRMKENLSETKSQ